MTSTSAGYEKQLRDADFHAMAVTGHSRGCHCGACDDLRAQSLWQAAEDDTLVLGDGCVEGHSPGNWDCELGADVD